MVQMLLGLSDMLALRCLRAALGWLGTLVCVVVLTCSDVQADDAPATDRLVHEAFQLNETDPESSVPTQEQAMKSPLKMGYYIMLLIERGKAAEESGDIDAAIKFYRALAKATPDRSTGLAELCRVYEKRGDIDAAIETCRAALGKGGVRVQDNVRFVGLLLQKPTDLCPKEVEDADAVLAHLEKELKSDAQVTEAVRNMRCELATRLGDVVRAQRCVQELQQKAPDDPKTLAYAFALALQKGDLDGARAVISHARKIALPRDAIQKMERAFAGRVEAKSTSAVRLLDWRFLAGVSALLVGVAFVLQALRRRRTIATGHAG